MDVTLQNTCLFKEGLHKVSDSNVFNHEFLYTSYTDDTTFLAKDLNSAKEVLSNLKLYSNVSRPYPSLEKCEIKGIGALKKM